MAVARSTKRGTAAGTAIALSMILTTPLQAEPGPREEEWWFKAWSIQDKVWPISRGGGVTVAVLDSGVNAKLPDLAGVVLRGTDVDTGGDGRRDHGAENGGHGTAMAALISGQGRGSGMWGVAPEAKILPIGIVGGSYYWARSIRYAVDHGAKVINISQGVVSDEPCLDKLQAAIDHAIRRDAVVVVSAGNQGDYSKRPQLPAKCNGVLVVGAVDSQRNVWEKSSPASYVSVAAPGVQVGSVGSDGNFISTVDGTSQAAALTSGVAALIRSKYPKMTGRQVVQRLIATAKDTGPQGWDDRSGYGTIIPRRALTEKVPANAPNPVYDRLDRWRAGHAQIPTSENSMDPGQNRRRQLDSGPQSGPSGGMILAAMTALAICGCFAFVCHKLFKKQILKK